MTEKRPPILKCPFCGTEMTARGLIHYSNGLPQLPKGISYSHYECSSCIKRTSPYWDKYGYQRVLVKSNDWYYFNDGCWNKLQIENPSSRLRGIVIE